MLLRAKTIKISLNTTVTPCGTIAISAMMKRYNVLEIVTDFVDLLIISGSGSGGLVTMRKGTESNRVAAWET